MRVLNDTIIKHFLRCSKFSKKLILSNKLEICRIKNPATHLAMNCRILKIFKYVLL